MHTKPWKIDKYTRNGNLEKTPTKSGTENVMTTKEKRVKITGKTIIR